MPTPTINYSWFELAGFWGTTTPGYARQFETINETITITSNLATGGAVFVEHLCKESGTESPTRSIVGPTVTLTSITPVVVPVDNLMYEYLFTVTGKYCEDLGINDSFVAYNSVTKQTFTYSGSSAFTNFIADVNSFGTSNQKFDKIISYKPDPIPEVTVDYVFSVEGSTLKASQRVHLVPTRYYKTLQTLLDKIHSNRNQDIYPFVFDTFSLAAAGLGPPPQTEFTLSSTPEGGADVLLNGNRLSTSSYSVSGNQISFSPGLVGTARVYHKDALGAWKRIQSGTYDVYDRNKAVISYSNTNDPPYSQDVQSENPDIANLQSKNWITPFNC